MVLTGAHWAEVLRLEVELLGRRLAAAEGERDAALETHHRCEEGLERMTQVGLASWVLMHWGGSGRCWQY